MSRTSQATDGTELGAREEIELDLARSVVRASEVARLAVGCFRLGCSAGRTPEKLGVTMGRRRGRRRRRYVRRAWLFCASGRCSISR